MAKGFKIADAWVEIHTDDDAARRGVRDLPRKLNPDADRAGRGVGDKLSQGIHMSIVRNSPLIAAGISAALAAGAPVALAGATALFAGIGIAAAAQSVAVRSAWRETWTDIKAGAFEDAGAIEQVLVGMAGKVSDGFERMRPALRDAFDAAAPQIDAFTDSLIQAGENALPGLVRAVQGAGPVMQGFGSFLESVGTGLSGFFDAMTDNAPAAGAAFAAIGDILGALLPILGELLGTGAELASVVLPPLASVLGVVAEVLGAISPVLPAVVAGFAAMKIAQSAAGWVGALNTKLNGLKSAFSAGNLAAAGLGVVIAGISADFANTKTEVDKWANALLLGGAAAAQVRQEYENDDYLLRSLDEWTGLAGSIDDAEQQMHDMLAAMTPMQRASALLTQAENDLSFAIEEHGAKSDEARAAKERYGAASAEVTRQEEALQRAIDGVTTAMIEQAEQALAVANAQFGYEVAVDNAEQSFADLQAAISEFGKSSEEADDAARNLSMDLLAQAEAAGAAAQEASGLGDSLGGQKVAAQATLQELYALREEYGSNFPPALENAIRGLEASGAAMGGAGVEAVLAADKASNFMQTLFDLGETEAVPTVDMDTAAFDTRLGATRRDLEGLDRENPTPTADMNINPFAGKKAQADAQIRNLDGQRPTPTANMNAGPFNSIFGAVGRRIANLHARRANPIANLIAHTAAAESALNRAARDRTSRIYTSYILTNRPPNAGTGAFAATGGRLGDVPVRKLSNGGRVEGPGGPTDDRVGPFLGERADLWFSDDEWVIKAMSANKYGDRLMSAVNAGIAEISIPSDRPQRRLAGGGPVGGAVAGGGNTYNVNLHMHGVDFSKQTDRRRILTEVRRGLVELERERS